MKNIKIFVVIILLTVLIQFLSINNYIYAASDPASSKGFAGYDDAAAAQETKNQIKEQEQKNTTSSGVNKSKSTDNYLVSLSATGYTLTPSFDKNITSYSLTEATNDSAVEIKAMAEDTNASVNGAGIVNLNAGANDIKIDVKSASGETRTYTISVTKKVEKSANLSLSKLELSTTDSNQNVQNLAISPEFNSQVFSYTCDIDADTDKVDVNAIANDTSNKVEVIGNENLQEGYNDVTIRVTSQDGSSNQAYIVKLNKAAKEDNKTNSNQILYIILIAIAAVIIIIIIVAVIKKHKKNSSRH